MSLWKSARLEHVCERITVGFVGKMADQYVEEGVPFLRSQNIQPFRVSNDGVRFISPEFHERIAKSTLRTGDVAIVRTGYPGTAAVIPRHLNESNCADLVVITPSAELNPDFLAGIFNSAWGKSHVGGRLVGSAQQHFNVGAAKAMEIRLPDRRSQDRIGEVLRAFSDLIENNRRRIEILEEMARLLYREWFVHFRFPGHEDVEMVASEVGPIPEGWEVCPIGERFKVVVGSTPSRKRDDFWGGDVHWVNSSSTRELRVLAGTEMITELGLDSTSTKMMPVGAAILAITGATLGEVSRLEVEACGSQNVCGVWDPEKSLNQFLYLDLCERITSIASKAHGGAQQHINKGIVEESPTIIPGREVADWFNVKVNAIFQLSANLLKQNRVLREARDLLLPRLVSGELDVSELNLDEVLA